MSECKHLWVALSERRLQNGEEVSSANIFCIHCLTRLSDFLDNGGKVSDEE